MTNRHAFGQRGARRRLQALGFGAALAALGPGLAAFQQACSSSGQDTTSGHRVVLHTRVTVEPTALSTFTSAFGWNVTLSKAAVATGPFYYFDGPPPLVLGPLKQDYRFAERWLGLGSAHAHPGHYQQGNAMGQMLRESSIDLLAGALSYPDGEGVSGMYRSGRFTYVTPSSGLAVAELSGHVAFAEGEARLDGQTPRFFRAFADLTDVEAHAASGDIDGCELTEADVETDGTVTLTINPKIWFDLVDFTTTDPGTADVLAEMPVGSQAKIAFVLGVTQLSAYRFSFSPP